MADLMGDVLEFLSDLDAAAKTTAADIQTVNAAAGESAREGGVGGGREGGSGGGDGMGSTAGPDGGPSTSGRSGGGPGFVSVTVSPLGAGQIIADLRSLKGR